MLVAVQKRNRLLLSMAFPLAAALALSFSLLWLTSGTRFALPAGGSNLAQVGKDTQTQFEQNRGQTDPSVLYMAHSGSAIIYFERDQVVLAQAGSPAGSALQVKFVGANQHATLSAEGSSASVVNYMVGSDPSKWHTNIPTYPGLAYSGLYNGVTLRYEGKQGELKGTYTVAPGADPSAIRWKYSQHGTGAAVSATSLDSAGNLHTSVAGKDVTERAPVAWQEISGTRVPVHCSYTLTGGVAGFVVGAYNHSMPLVIDPALQFSSYIGGASNDSTNGVATDAAGNMYITGLTNSADFPLLNAYQGSSAGANDVFVSKFNFNGTLAFSTYLGGGGDDYGYGIDVDSTGAIYVTGRTASANFPTHNAFQTAGGGNIDVFLSKLSNDGQTLIYSTYLGGSSADVGWGVAADAAGNAYVAGQIASTNFPTRNAYQATYGGGANDAFVARINTAASGDASLVYSTYMGGSNADYAGGSGVTSIGHGVATDGSGHAYVSGASNSDNFPTLNAYQAARVSDFDAFAARLDTNATGAASLTYSTLLGGNNYDIGRDIAVDAAGNAYITGSEGFSNFPTRSTYGACASGPFVAKFNMAVAGDASLVYSSCFGTLAHGTLSGISVVGNNAVVAGYSASTGWPLVNQIMGWTAGNDVIAARLNDSGSGLVYSTYLGGSGNDFGYDVASVLVSGDTHTFVGGSTDSTNYPVANPYQATNHGMTDGFVSEIDELAPAPTPTSTPPPPTPTSTPVVCQPNFSDVHESDYFYQAVQYLYCNGVIGGYTDGTFRPYNNTTRGQMVKIVTLGFNLPIYTPATPTFNDVPADSPFYQYVETAVHQGIVSGYPCGAEGEPCPGSYFRPGNNVTRGQLSKIVVIAASQVRGWTIINPAQPSFNDVPVGSAFYTYVETAVCHGLITGYTCGGAGEPCPGTYFRPGADAIRGQISKIVYLAITGTTVCSLDLPK